jgi:hypothetical protein
MQLGDPKKTAFLAVVAVGALFFCFKQLTGGDSTPKVLRQGAGAVATDPTAPPQASATVAMLQLDQLRVDPFSHAKLAPKSAGGPTPEQTQTSPPLDIDKGPIQLPELNGPFGTQIDKDRPGNWPMPVHPGQKDPVIKVEKVTQILLKAIVKVDQRMAYLAVDGLEARGFRAGELIKNDIEVVFVNDDSVIVKNRKTTVTLKVGQQGDL